MGWIMRPVVRGSHVINICSLNFGDSAQKEVELTQFILLKCLDKMVSLIFTMGTVAAPGDPEATLGSHLLF